MTDNPRQNTTNHTPRNHPTNPPPAPTRNHRAVATRLSLDGPDGPNSFESSATAAGRSPAIGGLLRFSPHTSTATAGTTGLSPYNRGRHNRTRFFGTANSTTKTGASLKGGTNHPPSAQNANAFDLDSSSLDLGSTNTTTTMSAARTDTQQQITNNNSTNTATTDNDQILDGIHLNYLRTLAEHALLESPAEATFYAGLLYSKTRAPPYALLLAQAYSQAHQHSSCLRLLEESNIIQSQTCEFWTQGLLLACRSLAAQGEWAALVEILEDACRLEPKAVNNSSTQNNDPLTSFRQVRASTALTRPLEDDDDFGWETLKESISVQQQQQEPPHHSLTYAEPAVHPLARLCVWRGRAYYETGHVLRAAVYWKRALRMDSRAVEAWQLLLEHALVTPTEGHDLLQKLEFAPHHEWLKALYMTRIELSTALPASMLAKPTSQQQQQQQQSSKEDEVMHDGDENHLNGSNGNGNSNSNNSTLLGNNSSMDKSGAPFAFRGTDFDASSISISSPIMPSNHFAATPGNSVMDNSGIGKQKTLSQADAKKALVDANVNAAFVKIRDVYKLQNSPQVLAMFAKRAYRQYQWKDVLDYCEQLAEMDPTLQTGGGAAYVYVAALLICGRKRTLFSLAHNWVEGSPKSAQAWFAVGAYYSCCGRHHIAQRHFCRATRLDPQCTEAWIAFGCSFAACDESDQALASFRAAQRLSPGEHTSLLYMGMEYNRTNHLVLAQNFLNTALQNSGGDPLCWHELGVLASNKGNFKEAIDSFGKVLSIIVGASSADVAGGIEQNVEQCTDPYWEPTIFNLGHAFRKSRHYEEASTCYLRCIALCPDKCSGYSAYAFACQLMGKSSKAVEYYHQALSCKPDDNFATEMLGRALSSYTSIGNKPTSAENSDLSLDNPTAHRLSFPTATPVGTMPEA